MHTLSKQSRGFFLAKSLRHGYGVIGWRGEWTVASWPITRDGAPDGGTEVTATTPTSKDADDVVRQHREAHS